MFLCVLFAPFGEYYWQSIAVLSICPALRSSFTTYLYVAEAPQTGATSSKEVHAPSTCAAKTNPFRMTSWPRKTSIADEDYSSGFRRNGCVERMLSHCSMQCTLSSNLSTSFHVDGGGKLLSMTRFEVLMVSFTSSASYMLALPSSCSSIVILRPSAI